MIKGMTGFGAAHIACGAIKGQLEIKSQNHRYFDISYYLPPGLSALETGIRQMINKNIERGRVVVAIKITEKPLSHIQFNKDAVQEYLKYEKVLSREYHLSGQLGLSDLIRLPGVVDAREVPMEVETLWPAVEKSLARAMKSLMAMRLREGRSLKQDMLNILKNMIGQIKKIVMQTDSILKEKRRTLSKEEFLALQKGNDVNEEITRLKHYIDEFRIHLQDKSGVGKKLDFIAQEMQRETNTIGSKVQDRQVTVAVIAIKSKIEKLREQAQNIE